MSASIFYQPVDHKSRVETGTPSGLTIALERAFGPMPILLDSGSYSALLGFIQAREDSKERASLSNLLETITVGPVRIWAEY